MTTVRSGMISPRPFTRCCTVAAPMPYSRTADSPIPLRYGLYEVGDAGFEPATSAVRRRRDGLQELSTGFKIPAKPLDPALMLFSSFQELYSGCCTVAAQAPKVAASA